MLYKELDGTVKIVYPLMTPIQLEEQYTRRTISKKETVKEYILAWINWFSTTSSNPGKQ